MKTEIERATVALHLRMRPTEIAAIERVAGRGGKSAYVRRLLRRDLIRRGELTPDEFERYLMDEQPRKRA